MINKYVSSGDADAALVFIRITILGEKEWPKGLIANLKSYIGGSPHRWMWDYASICKELEGAGFQEVRRPSLETLPSLVFQLWQPPNQLCSAPRCWVDGNRQPYFRWKCGSNFRA